MVRYDDMCGDWLLSTPKVFIPGFTGCRSREGGGSSQVSVMGLNVWQKDKRRGTGWPVRSAACSFGDRQQGWVTDYFTGEVQAEDTAGPPFGQVCRFRLLVRISGKGNAWWNITRERMHLPQPGELSTQPMSLWNFALEYTADGCS